MLIIVVRLYAGDNEDSGAVSELHWYWMIQVLAGEYPMQKTTVAVINSSCDAVSTPIFRVKRSFDMDLI